MKHFRVQFANGKEYTVHGDTHTEACEEARRLFPPLKDVEILASFLV